MAITLSKEESIAEAWPLPDSNYNTVTGSRTFARATISQRDLPDVGFAVVGQRPTTMCTGRPWVPRAGGSTKSRFDEIAGKSSPSSSVAPSLPKVSLRKL